MNASNLWQVMTPIKGQFRDHRWWPVQIVALYEKDAIRLAEQAAGSLGISFDGDIQLNHVGRVYTQEGE